MDSSAPTPQDELDEALLLRVAAATTSAEDDQAVQEWLAAGSGRQAYLDAVLAIWTQSPAVLGATSNRPVLEAGGLREPAVLPQEAIGDSAAVWARVMQRTQIQAPARSTGVPLQSVPWIQRWRYPAAIAASLIVVAGGIGLWDRVASRGATPEETGGHMQEFVTTHGQRATAVLDDGSRVTLGPASHLRYTEDPARGTRNVTLHGTALFTVNHTGSHPFIVHAAGTVTRVLGTTFTVRAYQNDSSVSVAVQDGRVAVRAASMSPSNEVILNGGEAAMVSSTSAAHVAKGLDVDALMAWTSGRIVFTNATASTIARELARWYDVEIHVAAALPVRHVNASLDATSLSDLLAVLAPALGARADIDGRTITLSPR